MDTRKLRQKILDLAIRGKLVPQDPNDEPASVLLERIKAEKEQLIKEGKIKRPKKTSSSDKSHYKNVPFEIPESWVWCKLSDIAYFGGGKTPSTSIKEFWDNGDVLWITSKDVKSKFIDDTQIKLTEVGTKGMTIYPINTIVMVVRSGILRRILPISITSKPSTINQDLKAIQCFKLNFTNYLYWVISALECYILENYQKDGTTVESIDFVRFQIILIPMPPINEQKRIVDEIYKWLDLITNIETEKIGLESYISQTKSKILDLAIQGKLVPQDPTDEPAIELLKRINPNFTPCDNSHYENIPFKIPQNWCWLSHNDILDISGGAQPAKSEFSEVMKPGYVRLYQIRDYGERPIPIFIPKSIANKMTQKGDILLARYGGSLGKVFIAEEGAYNVAMAKVIIRYPQIVNKTFIYYYYLSSIYKDKLKSISRTAQAGFNSGDFEDMYFPLPPIKEQIKITEKISSLWKLLETITAEL